MQKISLRTALIIAAGVLLLALIPTGFLIWKSYKLESENTELRQQATLDRESLTKSLQRAENTVVKSQESLDAFAKENSLDLDLIQQDLSSLGARLEAVASTQAVTKTIVHNNYISDKNTPSDIVTPTCPEDGRPIDIHGHTTKVETINLRDSNGMRIADASFEAAKAEPWSSKSYGIRYKINNAIGKNRDGRIILHTELLAESPDAEPGKTFRIEGVDSRVLQLPPEAARFDWWDPKVYLGVQVALIAYPELDFSAGFYLGFSVWSYGESWRFLGITAGYDAYQNNFRASFIPVMYNLGTPIPLLSDLWIFFDIGWAYERDVSVGFGIATTL